MRGHVGNQPANMNLWSQSLFTSPIFKITQNSKLWRGCKEKRNCGYAGNDGCRFHGNRMEVAQIPHNTSTIWPRSLLGINLWEIKYHMNNTPPCPCSLQDYSEQPRYRINPGVSNGWVGTENVTHKWCNTVCFKICAHVFEGPSESTSWRGWDLPSTGSLHQMSANASMRTSWSQGPSSPFSLHVDNRNSNLWAIIYCHPEWTLAGMWIASRVARTWTRHWDVWWKHTRW